MDEKDRITYYMFEFFETKNEMYATLVKEWLKKLAKKYHINLKKHQYARKPSVVDAYRNFLKNEMGYSVTVQKLYNAL